MSENVSEPFYLNGDQVVSVESGEVVAVLRNGVPVMQAGKNPLGKRVKEWFSASTAGAEGGMRDAECERKSEIRNSECEMRNEPLKAEGERLEEQEADMEDEEYMPEDEFAKDHLPPKQVVQIGAGKSVGTAAPEAEKQKAKGEKSKAEWFIDTIPDCSLPKFDPVLGVLTPEFQQFVQHYKLDQEQTAALVARLERKHRGAK